MPEQTDWEAKAANILKAELKRQGVTYAQLAEMDRRQGGEHPQQAVAREVQRGVHVATSGCPHGLRCESEPVEPDPVRTGGGKVTGRSSTLAPPVANGG
jgi:hypothetical protein